MAEKHKSKYKKPENKKPTYRKDIKDYTMDDKEGGLNPKTTGEKQLNVLRKTDKEMQDDGKMYPTYKDDDRLYKDLEDGEYDPKMAAKRLKKRQDAEEKEIADVIKDKVENLTREQKEYLIREYIRRKITKVLMEQPTSPEDELKTDTPAEELPVEEPTTPEAPAPNVAAPAADPAMATAPTPPAPDAATAPAAEAPAEEPAAETPADTELDPAAREALAVQRFVDHLKEETGNIARIKSISKVINAVLQDSEPEDYKNFFEMLRSLAINKLQRGQTKKSNTPNK
jgi:hypothetical protein